jgi:hypothetical protein
MPANPYTANTAWSASARYTAAADADILLSNASAQFTVLWTLTTSDTAPSITPSQANALAPDQSFPMQLASGERLWMAVRSGVNAPVNVEGPTSA